jgi:cytochrome c-type biogenesis protein CcmH/NrfG
LNANPNNVAAHGVCVRALELLGRPEEAVAACRAAWRVSNNPQPLSLAAALIAREELWRDNEDLLRALWMVQPNHPAVGSLLVLSLVEQGQVSQARSILESLTSASLDGRYLSRAREAVTKASAGR